MSSRLLKTTFSFTLFLKLSVAAVASEDILTFEWPPSPTQSMEPAERQEYWINRLQDSQNPMTADEYARAGIHLAGAVLTKDKSAFAFSKYFEIKPIDLETVTDLQTTILYMEASNCFISLNNEQKILYRDACGPLLRWRLKSGDNSLDTLLFIKRNFQFFGFAKEEAEASLRAAELSYDKNDIEFAKTLYARALHLSPEEFTLVHYRKAVRSFYRTHNFEDAIKLCNLVFKKFSEKELEAQDYYTLGYCFSSANQHSQACYYFTTYLDRKKGPLTQFDYRETARCFFAAKNYTRACEYFDLALAKGPFKGLDDYREAINAFHEKRKVSRVAELWKIALRLPGITPTYLDYFRAVSDLSTAKNGEGTVDIIDELMRFRKERDPADELPSDDLFHAANLYSLNKAWDKARDVWAQILKECTSVNYSIPYESFYVGAATEFYKLGDSELASKIFLCLTDEQILGIGKCYGIYAALSHRDAGNFKKAHALWKKANTRGSKLPGSAPHKARSIKLSDAALTNELRKSLASAELTTLRETLSQLSQCNDAELDGLYTQMKNYEQSASSFFTQLEKEGTGPSTQPRKASRAASSSSSAASSSSSAVSQASTNPLFEIQRLSKEVAQLKKTYDKQKEIFDRQNKERIIQHITDTMGENPVEYQWSHSPVSSPASSYKVKRPSSRSKGSAKKGSAPKRTTAASSSSSSSSVATSPSLVTWLITPTASKQLTLAKRVRGFNNKLERFRMAIENDPYARRGHTDDHAEGRAKTLKGYDNVFSRRIAKGERFFYRVEKGENDRVLVTILGVMGHDL